MNIGDILKDRMDLHSKTEEVRKQEGKILDAIDDVLRPYGLEIQSGSTRASKKTGNITSIKIKIVRG